MGRVVVYLATAVLAVMASVHASDRVFLEIGRSYPFAVNLVRVGAAKDWRTWQLGARWRLATHLEAKLGYWDNDAPGENTPSVWEVALTPVLRLQPNSSAGVIPYIESGIGAHLISEQRVTDRREFGGHFQFGSHVGLGLRLGAAHAYDLSLRVQHLSNARLKHPNDGINFASLHFAYRW